MKIRCPRCPETWTGTTAAHCAACHQTFSTDGVAAKAHRGPYDVMRCADPASVGLVKNARGYWATPGDAERLKSVHAKADGASEVEESTDDDDMEGCGYSYDHTTDEETRDGLTVWICRECGAEGWESADDEATA